jgi:hypothetical protein
MVSMLEALTSPIFFTEKKPLLGLLVRYGWGGRIRTYDLLSQNQAPYRLATPHQVLTVLWYKN